MSLGTEMLFPSRISWILVITDRPAGARSPTGPGIPKNPKYARKIFCVRIWEKTVLGRDRMSHGTVILLPSRISGILMITNRPTGARSPMGPVISKKPKYARKKTNILRAYFGKIRSGGEMRCRTDHKCYPHDVTPEL